MLPNELLPSLTVGIVSYAAGVLSGYFMRGFIREKIVKDSGNNLVLIVVTAIWAASMLVDIASSTYTTSPLVHGLMGAIVGYFYKPIGKNNG